MRSSILACVILARVPLLAAADPPPALVDGWEAVRVSHGPHRAGSECLGVERGCLGGTGCHAQIMPHQANENGTSAPCS